MAERWLATTAYGLESVTARELKDLGAEGIDAQTSRVYFSGDWALAARANVWLRSAGHVRYVVGEFQAPSFDALFEEIETMPWQDWIPRDGAYPVTARAVNSTLMSVPDIQAITKKAVSKALGEFYGQAHMAETGAAVPIEVHIHKDKAVVSLDTSGDALHLRGYRKLNGPAALRETLAASLVLLTKWKGDRPLADPFCGTGTILIEAAMAARHIAPGMRRTFLAESWEWVEQGLFQRARQGAHDAVDGSMLDIWGGDIDEESLSMAYFHAKRAGVADTLRFDKADIRKFRASASAGHIITNPPYGGRLGDEQEAQALYQIMGRQFSALPGWAVHVLCGNGQFERYYGARADKRRELRNGNIPCRYFEYFPRRVGDEK